jgi:hypothetical protein
MSALLAIAGRELRERWGLPLAAFCWGLVLLVPILRYDEKALSLAPVAAVPAAWVVALLMGGSVIARDLADGRLAFFFARPVPWWAIAGGKLLAALALTLATAVAGAVPTLLAGWDKAAFAAWLRDGLTGGGLAINLVLLLVLIGLGHAASVVYRSRSPWAALDFALFALAIAGGAALVRALARWGLWWGEPLPRERFVLGVLLVLATLALAPALVQVALGRSDIRRGHRAVSITLWSGVLLLLAVVGGFVAWAVSLGPEAFPSRYVTGASNDGRFVVLDAAREAQGPGSRARFLLDTRSGRALRLSALRSSPSFSPDGHGAVWLVEPFFSPGWLEEVELARLSGVTPEIEPVELESALPHARLRALALDAKAERVAILQSHTLSVHELPSGRTLSRSTAADGEWVTAAFLPDGRLRAFRRIRAVGGAPGRPTIPGFVEIVELAGGVPSSGIRLDAVGHAALWSAPDHERVLLLEPLAPRAYSLHEAASGRRLRVFTGEDGLAVHDAHLLEDGGVALIESDYERNRLRLALDGQPDRLVELPGGQASIGGALPGGLLSVGVGPALPRVVNRPPADAAQVLLIASQTGEIVRREPGLALATPSFGHASPATSSLFLASGGELVRLDAATGERRVLLKAAATGS